MTPEKNLKLRVGFLQLWTHVSGKKFGASFGFSQKIDFFKKEKKITGIFFLPKERMTWKSTTNIKIDTGRGGEEYFLRSFFLLTNGFDISRQPQGASIDLNHFCEGAAKLHCGSRKNKKSP